MNTKKFPPKVTNIEGGPKIVKKLLSDHEKSLLGIEIRRAATKICEIPLPAKKKVVKGSARAVPAASSRGSGPRNWAFNSHLKDSWMEGNDTDLEKTLTGTVPSERSSNDVNPIMWDNVNNCASGSGSSQQVYYRHISIPNPTFTQDLSNETVTFRTSRSILELLYYDQKRLTHTPKKCVEIICSDGYMYVHKILLAWSPLLREILVEDTSSRSVILLPDYEITDAAKTFLCLYMGFLVFNNFNDLMIVKALAKAMDFPKLTADFDYQQHAEEKQLVFFKEVKTARRSKKKDKKKKSIIDEMNMTEETSSTSPISESNSMEIEHEPAGPSDPLSAKMPTYPRGDFKAPRVNRIGTRSFDIKCPKTIVMQNKHGKNSASSSTSRTTQVFERDMDSNNSNAQNVSRKLRSQGKRSVHESNDGFVSGTTQTLPNKTDSNSIEPPPKINRKTEAYQDDNTRILPTPKTHKAPNIPIREEATIKERESVVNDEDKDHEDDTVYRDQDEAEASDAESLITPKRQTRANTARKAADNGEVQGTQTRRNTRSHRDVIPVRASDSKTSKITESLSEGKASGSGRMDNEDVGSGFTRDISSVPQFSLKNGTMKAGNTRTGLKEVAFENLRKTSALNPLQVDTIGNERSSSISNNGSYEKAIRKTVHRKKKSGCSKSKGSENDKEVTRPISIDNGATKSSKSQIESQTQGQTGNEVALETLFQQISELNSKGSTSDKELAVSQSPSSGNSSFEFEAILKDAHLTDVREKIQLPYFKLLSRLFVHVDQVPRALLNKCRKRAAPQPARKAPAPPQSPPPPPPPKAPTQCHKSTTPPELSPVMEIDNTFVDRAVEVPLMTETQVNPTNNVSQSPKINNRRESQDKTCIKSKDTIAHREATSQCTMPDSYIKTENKNQPAVSKTVSPPPRVSMRTGASTKTGNSSSNRKHDSAETSPLPPQNRHPDPNPGSMTMPNSSNIPPSHTSSNSQTPITQRNPNCSDLPSPLSCNNLPPTSVPSCSTRRIGPASKTGRSKYNGETTSSKDTYISGLKKCRHCKKVYKKVNGASICIKSHGLRRCWICLELIVDSMEGSEIYKQHCLDKRHGIEINAEAAQCPLCQNTILIERMADHVKQLHLNANGNIWPLHGKDATPVSLELEYGKIQAQSRDFVVEAAFVGKCKMKPSGEEGIGKKAPVGEPRPSGKIRTKINDDSDVPSRGKQSKFDKKITRSHSRIVKQLRKEGRGREMVEKATANLSYVARQRTPAASKRGPPIIVQVHDVVTPVENSVSEAHTSPAGYKLGNSCTSYNVGVQATVTDMFTNTNTNVATNSTGTWREFTGSQIKNSSNHDSVRALVTLAENEPEDGDTNNSVYQHTSTTTDRIKKLGTKIYKEYFKSQYQPQHEQVDGINRGSTSSIVGASHVPSTHITSRTRSTHGVAYQTKTQQHLGVQVLSRNSVNTPGHVPAADPIQVQDPVVGQNRALHNSTGCTEVQCTPPVVRQIHQAPSGPTKVTPPTDATYSHDAPTLEFLGVSFTPRIQNVEYSNLGWRFPTPRSALESSMEGLPLDGHQVRRSGIVRDTLNIVTTVPVQSHASQGVGVQQTSMQRIVGQMANINAISRTIPDKPIPTSSRILIGPNQVQPPASDLYLSQDSVRDVHFRVTKPTYAHPIKELCHHSQPASTLPIQVRSTCTMSRPNGVKIFPNPPAQVRQLLKSRQFRQHQAAGLVPTQLTTGQVRPPSTTGQVRPLSTTGQVRPPSTTGQVRPPITTGQVRPPITTGQVRPPIITGQVQPLITTGQLQPPITTGQVQPLITTGQVQPLITTGQLQPPITTGQLQPPTTTGQLQPPITTGQLQPPITTGQVRQQPTPGQFQQPPADGPVPPQSTTCQVRQLATPGQFQQTLATGQIQQQPTPGKFQQPPAAGQVRPPLLTTAIFRSLPRADHVHPTVSDVNQGQPTTGKTRVES